MTLRERVAKKAGRLKRIRSRANDLEIEIRADIDQMLIPHGSALDFARDLQISQQYVTDVRYGRRGLSNDIVEKLANLNKG